MKKYFTLLAVLVLIGSTAHLATAQDEIRTIFHGPAKITGYGALTNKFTNIDGQFVNMAGVYGGVYINHKFLIGVGGSAGTNNLPVPSQFSAIEGSKLSYEYVQFGLYTEYALASNRAIHPVFQLFAGPGLTVQYDREGDEKWDRWDDDIDEHHDENWFMVVEPGVQVEMNVFKWLRFSPGISYRIANGNNAKGLSDSKLSGTSVNVTLKFGRF